MFGEPIPTGVLQECWRQVERCDCVLLVGTSGTVNPAAQLPIVARNRGATLIEVNPHRTNLSSQCDLTLEGPSGEILPALVNLVRQRTPAD